MKKLLIILDPAHGEDVSGKRSPDGLHREYKWSRERLAAIAESLEKSGYTVVFTNTTDKETGLSVRKNVANTLAARHKGLTPFLISLHNDAKGDGSRWENARGVSVWTSVGKTTSDIFADIFIHKIPDTLPQAKQRIYSPGYLEKDFESNFTVLMGNYYAILIECLFQDNKEDVALLQTPSFNKQVQDWIVDSVDACNEYITKNLPK